VVNPLLPRKRQYVYGRQTVNGDQWTRLDINLHHATDEWRRKISSWWLGASYAYPREGETKGKFRMLVAGFRLVRVANPRKWYGWTPDPQVITVNQIGYKPLSTKWALANASHKTSTFVIKEAVGGQLVLDGKFEKTTSPIGDCLAGDFSRLTKPGRYYVESGKLSSVAFDVANRPFSEVAEACLRVLRGMRCGTETHFHPACHLDDFWDAKNERAVDMVGGYHDAADMLRQDHSQTPQQLSWHMQVYRLLPDGDPLRPAVLDEAKWCFRILEKHVKHFGQIVKASPDKNTVTDNVAGTADDRRLDGRNAGSFMRDALMGMAELANVVRETDPSLAKRALEVVSANAKYWGYGGYGAGQSTLGALAGYRALEDKQLRKRAFDIATQHGRHILRYQENRVMEGSDPVFSGAFAIKPDRSSFWLKHYEKIYLCHVTGLCDLMRTFPDHLDWYDWYFAVRRFADFYVKSAYQYTAPYVMPVDLYPEGVAEHAKSVNTGGFNTLLGEINGKKYYCPPVGHKLTSNTTLLATTLAAYAWTQAAMVLGDPEIENQAARLFGFTYLGENAFNWTRITGFGEEPCRTVWSYYRFVPGLVTCYPNLYFLSRTLPLAHINEIWTNTQAQAVLGCVCLDAPCLVTGRITLDGRPYDGEATIAMLGGRTLATFRTGGDGSYGPVSVAGGGRLKLSAAGVSRQFPAVAGMRACIDLDLQREIVLETEAITCRGEPVPIRRGFRTLKAGRPVAVRLRAKPIGKGASEHSIAIHAANATVEPSKVTVTVKPGQPASVAFTLRATAAGQTVCVLAEIGGDHTRKWEMSAVAE